MIDFLFHALTCAFWCFFWHKVTHYCSHKDHKHVPVVPVNWRTIFHKGGMKL